MFMEILFIIIKKPRNNTNIPQQGNEFKKWIHSYTGNQLTDKKPISNIATTWVNLTIITLSEIS